jgi:hypothetical protein
MAQMILVIPKTSHDYAGLTLGGWGDRATWA